MSEISTELLQRYILTLEKLYSMLQQVQEGTIDYELYRNSLVKGFEMTLEQSGKLLKKVLNPYFASKKMVDMLPVELNLCDGDVVELQSKKGNSPFYVFLLSRKGSIKTNLKGSTILINPGINMLFRVTESRAVK